MVALLQLWYILYMQYLNILKPQCMLKLKYVNLSSVAHRMEERGAVEGSKTAQNALQSAMYSQSLVRRWHMARGCLCIAIPDKRMHMAASESSRGRILEA